MEFRIAMYKTNDGTGLYELKHNGHQLFCEEDGNIFWFDDTKTKQYLIQWLDETRYFRVDVNTGNKTIHLCTHKIMAYSWLGLPPPSMLNPSVDHRNGRCFDNNYKNLQFLSVKDNKAKRHFGSNNALNLEKIGRRDARYQVRDTKRRTNNIKSKDDAADYDSIINDAQDFLSMYM